MYTYTVSVHSGVSIHTSTCVYRVEGRSWYTTHRGRLWIAAAVKEPSQTDIEQQRHFYRTLYGGILHVVYVVLVMHDSILIIHY